MLPSFLWSPPDCIGRFAAKDGTTKGPVSYVYLYIPSADGGMAFQLNVPEDMVPRDHGLGNAMMRDTPMEAAQKAIASDIAEALIDDADEGIDIPDVMTMAGVLVWVTRQLSAQRGNERDGGIDHIILIADEDDGECVAVIHLDASTEAGSMGPADLHDVAVAHADEFTCDEDAFLAEDTVIGTAYLFDSGRDGGVVVLPMVCPGGPLQTTPISLANTGVSLRLMFDECVGRPEVQDAMQVDISRALLVLFADALRKQWAGKPEGHTPGVDWCTCYCFDLARMPDFGADHAPGWVRVIAEPTALTGEQAWEKYARASE